MNPSNYLNQILGNSKKQQFTGTIILTSSKKIEWKMYFFVGKLAWISGGIHSNRSWLRHLIKHFSEIDVHNIKFREGETYECRQYHTLKVMLQRNLIDIGQIHSIIQSRFKEIFFDILQESTREKLQTSINPQTPHQLFNAGFKPSLVLDNISEIFKDSQNNYLLWCQQGGTYLSLNNAPLVVNAEELQNQVTTGVYQSFLQYFNGKNSLRDLSLKLNKNDLKLSLSLLSYLRQKLIKLVEINDIPVYYTVDKYFVSEKQNTNSTIKLNIYQKKVSIACIDDSPMICKIMQNIMTNAGYKFVGIQEPIQAIPQLIETKPNLIFIDLGMPIINGYELCSQIKRVSQLKNIPIVMLTGRNFLEDRVRSKVVGASDFIPKPIVEEVVLKTVEKFAHNLIAC